ncbi:protein of unknown function [Xenorhabdus poinarii G6]|uniref:Uncharacterized protein n=1 Tax=Xenorhabdus poinarii G6 TaxID=1354304 RepID=A0A068R2W0_9GAMM|nr:protein of unknown function [Xenorhabdus poinarii G6]
MICVPPFKGKAWSKLTSIAVIVTNQNMLKDMEKRIAGILVIVAIPAGLGTPVKTKSGPCFWRSQ